MNKKFKSILLALAFILSLSTQPVFGQSEAKEKSEKDPKGSLLALPNNRVVKGCFPAEVTYVAQSEKPPEGLEVVIKNYTAKIINAVKIGWYIVEDEEKNLAGRILKVPCYGPPLSDQIVLSGETSLIEIGPLHMQQTAAIGKKPLKYVYETQDRVIMTDFDFITMDDVKDLFNDEVRDLGTEGKPKAFKKIYAVILAVSEIQYADGSSWKAEEVPAPLTPGN